MAMKNILIYLTSPLPLVDDAGYFFAVWGGYCEPVDVNRFLLNVTGIHTHNNWSVFIYSN